MGFRYAVLAFKGAEADQQKLFAAELGISIGPPNLNSTISLPSNLQEGKLWHVQTPKWEAIVFPYQLLYRIHYDASNIASAAGVPVIGAGVEGTAGETWYQKFQDGKIVGSYHCGDGIVATSKGIHPDIAPQDWTDEAVFEFRCVTLTAHRTSSCAQIIARSCLLDPGQSK